MFCTEETCYGWLAILKRAVVCIYVPLIFLSFLMAPKEKFNPFPPLKKGVRRMIAKRPSAMKSAIWNKILYVKDNNGGHVRMEKAKWRRTIQELLSASNEKIIEILTADGIRPNWKGCVCPHCQSGKLGPLTSNGRDDILRYRCNKKGCQRYFLPQHLHPFFTATNGPEGHSLQMQAAALLLRLLNVPLPNIHLLTHINHKALEKFNRSILLMRKGYVQKAEKEIKFGGCPRAWKEVEADEATFDKKTFSPQELGVNHDKPVLWEQWGAIAQRGALETLVLTKVNPAMTVPRAPGPGAIRKVDWKPLALKHIANRNVILHTDSASSYKMKLPGVVHDAVVHKKKRVKKNGKWVWLKPTFVRISKHKLPDGRRISCKAGTQIADRAWKFIKARISRNQYVKASLHRFAVHSGSTGTANEISGCVLDMLLLPTWKAL